MQAPMNNEHSVVDRRVLLYRGLKHFALVLLLGLVAKSFIIDSVVIQGDQMSPTLLKGDRIVYFKAPYIIGDLSPLPRRGTPVLFRSVVDNLPDLLRISSHSGDTVSADSGILYTGARPFEFSSVKGDSIIPPSYSPRDFFEPYVVPSPGDSIRLSSLSTRDFLFSLSVLLQEQPHKTIMFNAKVLSSDSVIDNFTVDDFALYNGPLNQLPKHLKYDPVFWQRFESHLQQNASQPLKLRFSVFDDTHEIDLFKVSGNYVFLIADNWLLGLDSRYFGPVRISRIIARPFGVLWSHNLDSDGNRRFIKSRIGKIIKRREK